MDMGSKPTSRRTPACYTFILPLEQLVLLIIVMMMMIIIIIIILIIIMGFSNIM